MLVKLNIGSGTAVNIDGFTNVDRAFGLEAWPLNYVDESVDEIRASHILEHFGVHVVPLVLKDWVRTLKPGGRIRLAVPDFAKIIERTDPRWAAYLMGGQTDENDFHKSVFDSHYLERIMADAGLVDIQPWTSTNTDCASLPVSLNREGCKPSLPADARALAEIEADTVRLKADRPITFRNVTRTDATLGCPIQEKTIKITAVMSLGRTGYNDSWGEIQNALRPFGIPIYRTTGAFWGHCMHRGFEGCMAKGIDWILAIDQDSLFKAKHLDELMGTFGSHAEIDALAALQCRRTTDQPLMYREDRKDVEITGQPIKVDAAHFGLTLIRMDALKDIPKPWFASRPDAKGGYGEGRVDDDIWFWQQWKKADKTVCVAPNVRIGHLEVNVADFDDDFKARRRTMQEWRQEHDPNSVS